MIESPLTTTERDRLRDAVDHICQACDILERTVKDYEKEHDIADPLQYHRVLKIARSTEYTDEQKVGMIAEIMRSFNFLLLQRNANPRKNHSQQGKHALRTASCARGEQG